MASAPFYKDRFKGYPRRTWRMTSSADTQLTVVITAPGIDIPSVLLGVGVSGARSDPRRLPPTR